VNQAAPRRRQQYLLFRMVRDAFPAVAVVAIAAGIPLTDIAPLMDEYLNGDSAIAHPTPLVSGQVLMSTLSLGSGPLVGQLLAALELAHAEGIIENSAEAIQMAQQMVPNPNRFPDSSIHP
jgi:tRNA nucleotidyltransferase (CCA-adding enzyme)